MTPVRLYDTVSNTFFALVVQPAVPRVGDGFVVSNGVVCRVDRVVWRVGGDTNLYLTPQGANFVGKQWWLDRIERGEHRSQEEK